MTDRRVLPDTRRGPLVTHKELAARFGVSRARIFQIEQRAFEKIRKALAQEARLAGMTLKTYLFGDE
jgi:DNA-directed RNA polymerase sigma subunit (sigma70/sigma32)